MARIIYYGNEERAKDHVASLRHPGARETFRVYERTLKAGGVAMPIWVVVATPKIPEARQ